MCSSDLGAVVVVGGDLNAPPGSPPIRLLSDAGWTDTHRAAGNTECDPRTGAQCTSGRVDSDLSDLRDPRSRQSERIDYLWLTGRDGCRVGSPTGLFGARPAPDGPGGLAFASDHTGVEATIVCTTSDEQRRTAATATLPPSPTSTVAAGGAADATTTAAVTAAFRTVFAGTVTNPERKLAALEEIGRAHV